MIWKLGKINIFRWDGTAPGCFQKIKTFTYCNLAKPGFFIKPIKGGKIFVGGQEYLLGKVFCIKRVAYGFQTNGIDKILVLLN